MVVALVGLALAIAASGGKSAATGPPRGLTQYGRLVWQLEALVHDTIGFGGACVVYRTGSIEPARRCRNLSLAEAGDWDVVFARARHSAFRLTPARPDLGNVLPVKIRGRFVSCGGNRYLAELHGSAREGFRCVTPF